MFRTFCFADRLDKNEFRLKKKQSPKRKQWCIHVSFLLKVERIAWVPLLLFQTNFHLLAQLFCTDIFLQSFWVYFTKVIQNSDKNPNI